MNGPCLVSAGSCWPACCQRSWCLHAFVQAGLTAAACCMIRMDARRSHVICMGVQGCAQWYHGCNLAAAGIRWKKQLISGSSTAFAGNGQCDCGAAVIASAASDCCELQVNIHSKLPLHNACADMPGISLACRCPAVVLHSRTWALLGLPMGRWDPSVWRPPVGAIGSRGFWCECLINRHQAWLV